MLAIREALKLVLEQTSRLEPRSVDLPDSLGLVLAEEVRSDIDLPPFDRAAMDGFALRAEDTRDPPSSLRRIGEVAAGQTADFEIEPGQTAAISTGAPLPPGADAVQKIEKVRVEGERVFFLEPVERGCNVVSQGRELAGGGVALEPDTTLGPAAIGILAMVGRARVLVHPRPRVAVLATGSELVGIDDRPGPGRIRNSNGPMLAACARDCGGEVELEAAVPDDEARLERAVVRGLASDLLLLTGGVSVGEHDLVEAALERLGVRLHFRSVAIRPGKPVTFGTHDGGVVFGLPGNPVSAFVTFHVFAACALRRLMGRPRAVGARVRAILRHGFPWHSQRAGYLPAWAEWEDGGWTVRKTELSGSADLVPVARSNALLLCPAGEAEMHEGRSVDVLLLEGWHRY